MQSVVSEQECVGLSFLIALEMCGGSPRDLVPSPMGVILELLYEMIVTEIRTWHLSCAICRRTSHSILFITYLA